MPVPKKNLSLKIYMNSVAVGVLQKSPNGGLTFQYENAWLNSSNSIPLSLSLPLTPISYAGDLVINYFDNLLPDNDGIRKTLAQRMSLNNSEVFDLLAAIGRDCAGAVQLIPMGEEIIPYKKINAIPISEREISEILKNLKNYPLGVKPGDDFRISIAGAQEKTAFLKLKNGWHLPQGSTPSSHIFKVQMGVLREQIDMSHSVENEWLCLKICKAYGIPTASAEIADFNGVRALIVERFDREFNQHSVLRYAQEDFCQVAGAPSHKKYEYDGGPGILQIMKTLTKSDNPTSDKRLFMTSQIVFWLLAAIDGHAKNFSIFLMPGGIKLTPLYDVMSAHPAIVKKQIPFEKAKLAMAVGTNRHYKIREITKRHWLQTAKMAQFSEHETEGIIENLKSQTDEVIAAVTAQLPKGFPKEVSKPIFDGLSKMAKILK